MDNLFKAVITVVSFILLSFFSMCVIVSSASARSADDYMQSCIQKIESSNYAPAVIEACEADAADKGYVLTIDTYKNPTTNQAMYGTATMKYTYYLPFVSMQRERAIEADLR